MIQRSLLRNAAAISRPLRSFPRSFSPSLAFSPARAISSPLPQRTIATSRWYSTPVRPDGKVDTNSATSQPQTDETEEEEEEEEELSLLEKDLETKEREIIDLKDRYLRSVAEFRNLQERTKRDVQAARDFAITRFATDLVESVDNLDRALSTVPVETLARADGGGPELKGLYEGLKMTEAILMQTLKKHGLERFDPVEQKAMFDPRLHEATFQTKVEGKDDGQVFMTQQKGFLLNGRVLRAAKVGVVKNS